MPVLIIVSAILIALSYGLTGTGSGRQDTLVATELGTAADRWAGCTRPSLWSPNLEQAARDCAQWKADKEEFTGRAVHSWGRGE